MPHRREPTMPPQGSLTTQRGGPTQAAAGHAAGVIWGTRAFRWSHMNLPPLMQRSPTKMRRLEWV